MTEKYEKFKENYYNLNMRKAERICVKNPEIVKKELTIEELTGIFNYQLSKLNLKYTTIRK